MLNVSAQSFSIPSNLPASKSTLPTQRVGKKSPYVPFAITRFSQAASQVKEALKPNSKFDPNTLWGRLNQVVNAMGGYVTLAIEDKQVYTSLEQAVRVFPKSK